MVCHFIRQKAVIVYISVNVLKNDRNDEKGLYDDLFVLVKLSRFIRTEFVSINASVHMLQCPS